MRAAGLALQTLSTLCSLARRHDGRATAIASPPGAMQSYVALFAYEAPQIACFAIQLVENLCWANEARSAAAVTAGALNAAIQLLGRKDADAGVQKGARH